MLKEISDKVLFWGLLIALGILIILKLFCVPAPILWAIPLGVTLGAYIFKWVCIYMIWKFGDLTPNKKL